MATAEDSDSPVAMKLKKMWLKTPVSEEQAAQAVLDPAIGKYISIFLLFMLNMHILFAMATDSNKYKIYASNILSRWATRAKNDIKKNYDYSSSFLYTIFFSICFFRCNLCLSKNDFLLLFFRFLPSGLLKWWCRWAKRRQKIESRKNSLLFHFCFLRVINFFYRD